MQSLLSAVTKRKKRLKENKGSASDFLKWNFFWNSFLLQLCSDVRCEIFKRAFMRLPIHLQSTHEFIDRNRFFLYDSLLNNIYY